jgi:hypothetical protein
VGADAEPQAQSLQRRRNGRTPLRDGIRDETIWKISACEVRFSAEDHEAQLLVDLLVGGRSIARGDETEN